MMYAGLERWLHLNLPYFLMNLDKTMENSNSWLVKLCRGLRWLLDL